MGRGELIRTVSVGCSLHSLHSGVSMGLPASDPVATGTFQAAYYCYHTSVRNSGLDRKQDAIENSTARAEFRLPDVVLKQHNPDERDYAGSYSLGRTGDFCVRHDGLPFSQSTLTAMLRSAEQGAGRLPRFPFLPWRSLDRSKVTFIFS